MSDTASPRPSQSLGIGTIISDSFALTLKNFFPMLLIMIAPFALMAVLGYLLFGSVIQSALVDPVGLDRDIAQDPVGFFINYGIFTLFLVLAFSFTYAAGISLIFDAKAGRSASIGGAFGTGFSRTLQLFVVSMVVGVLLVLSLAVVSAIFGVIGIPALAGVVILVFSLWLYGLILPLPSVVVVENMWFGALGRTLNLTAGYRWWIVLLLIVFSLAMIVVYLIMVLIGYVSALLGTVGFVIGGIVGLVGTVVIFGSAVALIALVYARLREIKEGTTMDTLADVFD